MRRFMIVTASAALVSAPVQAEVWNGGGERIGAFAGARLRLSLGGTRDRRVETALSLAPTRVGRWPAFADRSTVVGRGLELDLARRKPELKLAGIRADKVIQLTTGTPAQAGQTAGLSKGAWVGIAAGVVVIGAVVFVATMTCVGRDRDYCGSD